MIQLSPDAQVDTFRLILEMENRGQQVDGIFVRLKQTFIQNGGSVSIPDAVGALDELSWHVNQISELAAALETTIGIQRKPLNNKPASGRSGKAVDQLRGTTRTISLRDLVELLSRQSKTGTLKIRAEHGERFILEMLAGEVVHAATDTPLPNQMLGNILVAQQKLTSERLQQFLSHFSPSSGRFGEALVNAEVVSKEDLLDAIEEQVRRLFDRIFRIENAAFCFTDGPTSQLELRVTLNAATLLDPELEAVEEPTSDSGSANVVEFADVVSSVVAELNELEALEPTEALEGVDVSTLMNVLGIRRKPAEELVGRELPSVDVLRDWTDQQILEVPGIGRKTLERIRAVVNI